MYKLLCEFPFDHGISYGENPAKNIKKIVDKQRFMLYNTSCVAEVSKNKILPGCGSAWLERLVWDQEVA
ncbi:MAG: hypothetical protein Q4C52_10175, partial [Eubacteriales bacterium]|nr:hypothetical protein [Eubacteriales bacterium]